MKMLLLRLLHIPIIVILTIITMLGIAPAIYYILTGKDWLKVIDKILELIKLKY